MKRDTFHVCKECGRMVVELVPSDSEVSELYCCGEPMVIAEPNADGAPEKHIPDCHIDGSLLSVNVGEVDHPMADNHYISWVYVVTDEGVLAKCLKPGDEPHAAFELGGQTPREVFEYCTVHGLWKVEL